jgi:hypothetical protein
MAEPKTFGQWSFNGGELSPRMLGRTDQAIYAVAVEEMLGWLPLLQGPATAAPGTIYVATAAGPCRLISFEFNPTQGYSIEASAAKFRFFTNDARIETAPGVAYEVAHPYSLSELQQLDFWQSNDVLYLAGANKKPKKLTRLTATTFALTDLNLTEGPIEIGNSDEAVTVTVSATTGAITITASASIFAAGDVGGFFEIDAKDFNDVPSWEPAVDNLTVGIKRAWNGRVYQMTQLTNYTGTTPPEHDEGEAWDGVAAGLDSNGHGPYGAKWLYLYNRYGLVKITGYTSPTQVTATVIKRLADSLTGTATWRWAFGAFSDTRGWPDTVGGWNDCLVLTKGNRGYTSVITDFENFGRRDGSGDFQRDLSGGFTLPKPATINWQASDRYLLLGTDTDEYTVERVQVQTGTPGPPVFDIRLQSSNGSKKAKPVQADGRMLFLQRAGRKLREMGYAISSDRYVAPDMTRLADHIGAAGLIEMAWQAEPERLVWAVRGDGLLAAMTYDPEQQVMGWARRQLGGVLKAASICRITDPEGKRDQIWLSVDAGGGTFWVLRMAKVWEYGDDQVDALLLDAALSYDGVPVASGTGGPILRARPSSVLADGKVHPDIVLVGAGEWSRSTMPPARSTLACRSKRCLKLLPPEAGQDEGTARGKVKRILDLTLHVVETQGIQVTVQNGDPIMIETRIAADPMDQAVPLLTGLRKIPTIGSYEEFGTVLIERVQPTPATIIAAIPTIEVGDR